MCLSRQKYACWDKHIFVVTNIILSWQNFCHEKLTFVATNTSFVVTKVCLSRQNICRGKHSDNNITYCGKECYHGKEHYLLCQRILLTLSRNVTVSECYLPCQATCLTMSRNVTYCVKGCYYVKEYYCQWTLLTMSNNRSYHVKECHLLCRGVLLTMSRNITVSEHYLPCQTTGLTMSRNVTYCVKGCYVLRQGSIFVHFASLKIGQIKKRIKIVLRGQINTKIFSQHVQEAVCLWWGSGFYLCRHYVSDFSKLALL